MPRPLVAPPPAPAAAAAGTMPPASPWHSPVPYLFGGLAAMLGLIALALLILACSYWKLNSLLGTGDAAAGTGAADGDGSKSPAAAAAASPAAFADLVAVVMAGEKTPTFLAAPIVHRARDGSATTAGGEGSPATEDEENRGKRPGEEESRAVADAERGRQLDHV